MVEQCQQLTSLIKSRPLFKKKKSGKVDLFLFFYLHLNLSILKNKTKNTSLLLGGTVQKHSRQWHIHSHLKNQSQEQFITGKFPGLREAP